MIGTSVAHYNITEKIGEGGMGEVYRAHDTKLNRDVALKILPQIFALDSQRMARFEREAQVLASLNHSHIAQIHGLEETDGRKALVLELVEGETLQQQIARGPIPVDEALKIALQICEGLEAAHEKGIIHRDLKPANIKITPEGEVKILDFGLAKALDGETPVSDLSHSPTITHAATQAGVILGTAAYMSPEQARGKPVDKRTDIWAFGCVLYEMLTAKKAFGGDGSDETVSDVLASVLAREPDWEVFPESMSWRCRDILKRCLSKEPRDRLHDIADVRIELDQIRTQPDLRSAPSRAAWASLVPWIIAGLVVLASGLNVWFSGQELPASDISIKRLSVSLPFDAPMATIGSAPLGGGRPCLAITEDGASLVYVAETGGETRLYLRQLNEFDPRPIPGTEGAYHPFFSPDGKWVGFFVGNELKKVSVAGGAPITLCEAANPHGGTWGLDGNIIFSSQEGRRLSSIPAGGGTPRVLVENWATFNWPALLPGGKAALFSSWPWSSGVFNIETSEWQTLVEGATYPRYLPSGHLVYALDGRLFVTSFDPDSMRILGSPVPIPEQVRVEGGLAAQYTFSANGTLVYAPGTVFGMGNLVWVDRQGNEEDSGFPADLFGTFQISPDGNRLAVEVFKSGKPQLWIYELDRLTRTRLSPEEGFFPIWTPEGDLVTYTARTDEGITVSTIAADGSPQVERLLTAEAWEMPFSWSPKGELLALNGESDITLFSPPAGKVEVLTETTQFSEWGPAFSPDGNLIAYTSDEQGQYDVFVEPYPQTGEKWRISNEGGSEEPVWSPTRNEIYFRTNTKWMVVSYATEPKFEHSLPRELFEGNYVNVAGRSYDVSRDGEKFLLIKSIEEQPTVSELHIVQNWFEELKRLVPTE